MRISFVAVAGLALGMTLTSVAQAQQQTHPRLHRAIFEMREAERELAAAPHNFNGHRERAVQDLRAAYGELEAALRLVNEPYVSYTPAPNAYGRYRNHPHLRHSLEEMRAAKESLEKAPRIFGGHKAKAIRDIDAAIIQVEKCLEHAR